MDDQAHPLLVAAFFCEQVLQERDGVLSAVRIIDTYIHKFPASAPEEGRSAAIQPNLVIILKSGDFEGRGAVTVAIRTPGGERREVPQAFPVFLEGGHNGANIIVRLQVETDVPGLYWFDVSWEEKVLISTPLQVKHESMQPKTGPDN